MRVHLEFPTVEVVDKVALEQLRGACSTCHIETTPKSIFHGEVLDSTLVQNEAMKMMGKYARHAVPMWTNMFLD